MGISHHKRIAIAKQTTKGKAAIKQGNRFF